MAETKDIKVGDIATRASSDDAALFDEQRRSLETALETLEEPLCQVRRMVYNKRPFKPAELERLFEVMGRATETIGAALPVHPLREESR